MRRRWRRRTTGLVVLVLVLGGIYVGLDLVARSITEHRLAQAISRRTAASSVSVDTPALPFLFHLVVDGDVSTLHVFLRDVPIGPLVLPRATLRAEQVNVDRADAIEHQALHVTRVGNATASAAISVSALDRAIGQQVRLGPGNRVRATIDGILVSAELQIHANNVLTVDTDGRQLLRIDLGTSPLLERCPVQLAVTPHALALRCSVSPVPAPLLATIGG